MMLELLIMESKASFKLEFERKLLLLDSPSRNDGNGNSLNNFISLTKLDFSELLITGGSRRMIELSPELLNSDFIKSSQINFALL